MADRSAFDLKIANYRSIASLEIGGLRPFSVFAGPNGSGKSNFCDALDFVGRVCRHGVEDALRAHGGAANVRSAKRYAPYNQRFEFRMDLHDADGHAEQRDQPSSYTLKIHDLDTAPKVEEAGFRQHPLAELLTNVTVYRVDPRSAKVPDRSDADPSALNANGSNLAVVLRRIEADSEARQLIGEWVEMVAPGVQAITNQRQRLDQVSDGTVYALSLLVADRRDSPCITLIEQPERGLHPAAIAEFVELLRDSAGPSNPIWVTTHSESVVRRARLAELILVDKKRGRTKMKRADSGALKQEDMEQLGLETAWLSNLLDGGVPW